MAAISRFRITSRPSTISKPSVRSAKSLPATTRSAFRPSSTIESRDTEIDEHDQAVKQRDNVRLRLHTSNKALEKADLDFEDLTQEDDRAVQACANCNHLLVAYAMEREIKQPSLCDSDNAVAGSVSLPFGRRYLLFPHLPHHAASINLEAEAGGESPPGLSANYTPPASAAHNKADCTNPRVFRGECLKCQQTGCVGSSLELVDTWVTSLCLQGRWISDTPYTWVQDVQEMFGLPTLRKLTESDFSRVDYAPKEMNCNGHEHSWPFLLGIRMPFTGRDMTCDTGPCG
ncbi:hypothetical protein HDK64DRAFT_321505 [Phyllosticta capitalensis]